MKRYQINFNFGFVQFVIQRHYHYPSPSPHHRSRMCCCILWLFVFFCAVFRGLIKFMSSAESRVRCMNSSISAVENLSLYLYGHLSSLWRRSFRAVWTFGFCRDRLCSFCSFYLYFNIHYICISKSTKTACITLSAHHGAFERVFTNARVNRDSVNQYKKRRKKNSVHISSRECVYMGFVCSFE